MNTLSLKTLVLFMASLFMCCTTSEPSPGKGGADNSKPSLPLPDTSSWELVFEDDFNGSSREPNPDYWILCEKGTDTWNRYLSESYDQAYQEGGYLYLLAELIDGNYQTGAIETRGKFDFMYGKVECSAKFLRHPQGGHTGIWMMPSPPAETWPKSGEIDIQEHLNSDGIVYETVHSWYLDDQDHTNPVGRRTAPVNVDDWNTYGLIWTADSLIYTVNGEAHLTYPNLKLGGQEGDYQWPFNHNFYLILSQSLGGKGTWPGVIDDSQLPAIFIIDWIKVYQKPEE